MSDAWIHRLASARQCLMQFLSISVDLLVPDSSGMLAVKGSLHQNWLFVAFAELWASSLTEKSIISP